MKTKQPQYTLNTLRLNATYEHAHATIAQDIRPTRTDDIDESSEVRQWPSAAITTGNDELKAHNTNINTVAVWGLPTDR